MCTIRVLLYQKADPCHFSAFSALDRFIIKTDLRILGFFQFFLRDLHNFSPEISPVIKWRIFDFSQRFFKSSLLYQAFHCFGSIGIHHIQCKFQFCNRIRFLRRPRHHQHIPRFTLKPVILCSQDFVDSCRKQ